MRFLFCGDRNWTDIDSIRSVMVLLQETFGQYTVIEGEAPGADTISKVLSRQLDLLLDPYPAQWRIFGRAAGPIRNARMLKEGYPDGVLAFHPNLIESRGTMNMVEQAIKASIPVWISTEGQEKLISFINTVKKI